MNKSKNSEAQVIEVIDDFTVAINRGSEDGIKKGDLYLIYQLGNELYDPDTGKSLGKLEIVKGRARVTHVQTFIATLRSIETKKGFSAKKIVTRNASSFATAAILGILPQTEEIFEDPSEHEVELNAEKGNYARPI